MIGFRKLEYRVLGIPASQAAKKPASELIEQSERFTWD
jgi:hypothetical protein